MKAKPVVAVLVLAYAVWLPPGLTAADESKRRATPRESRIPAGNAELYSREVGQGTAIIVPCGAQTD
jgi:hypothetical protein